MSQGVSPARTQTRDLYWKPWDAPGCEHAAVRLGARGTLVDSVILLRRDDRALRCHYRLETDAAWRVRALHLALQLGGASKREKDITLTADGKGRWRVDGTPAPHLDGCLDLDIQITPLTNTLPIRRLGLAEGEWAEIRVAYLPVPDLAPRPAEQRYSCLKALGPPGGLFRYEGLFRGFTADLPVDSNGFVVDYPETFRRIW